MASPEFSHISTFDLLYIQRQCATIALLGVFAGGLMLQVYRYSQNMNGKTARIAILVQLSLCLARNLGMLSETLLMPDQVNCKILGMASFGFYSVWPVALDYVLYLRARIFSDNPKFLFRICMIIWTAFLGIRVFTMTTYTSSDGLRHGPIPWCSARPDGRIQDFTSPITLALRTALQLLVLAPFVQKAIHSYRMLEGDTRDKWLFMSITNCFVTSLIIMLEVISYGLGQAGVFLGAWRSPLYAFINFAEANLVLFVLNDMRSKLSQTRQSLKSFSKNAKESNIFIDNSVKREKVRWPEAPEPTFSTLSAVGEHPPSWKPDIKEPSWIPENPDKVAAKSVYDTQLSWMRESAANRSSLSRTDLESQPAWLNDSQQSFGDMMHSDSPKHDLSPWTRDIDANRAMFKQSNDTNWMRNRSSIKPPSPSKLEWITEANECEDPPCLNAKSATQQPSPLSDATFSWKE